MSETQLDRRSRAFRARRTSMAILLHSISLGGMSGLTNTQARAMDAGRSVHADKCDVAGRPPAILGVHDFWIDAVSATSSDTLRFSQHDRVRVIVCDINPFLYSSYRISIQKHTIAEASPADFLKVVLGIDVPKSVANVDAATNTLKATESPRVTPLLPLPPLCSDPSQEGPATAALTKIVPKWDALLVEDTSIATALRSVTDEMRAPERAYRAAIDLILDGQARAEIVKRNATEASASANLIAQIIERGLDEVAPRIKRFGEQLAVLAKESDSLSKTYSTCTFFDGLARSVLQLREDSARFESVQATLSSRRVEARRSATTLRRGTNPRAYYLATSVMSFSGPADVDVLIVARAADLFGETTPGPVRGGEPAPASRPVSNSATTGSATVTTTTVVTMPAQAPKTDAPANTPANSSPNAAPLDTVGQYTFNIGGRGILTLTGGAAWTDLPARSYTLLSRVVPAADGLAVDTVGVVFNNRDSHNRVVPILVLDAALVEWASKPRRLFTDGLHVAFGGGVQSDRSKLEYLAGGALSFLDRRLFLTYGVYLGPTERLASGFAVGSVLPKGVTTPPTQASTGIRQGAAITFRMVPWGTGTQ